MSVWNYGPGNHRHANHDIIKSAQRYDKMMHPDLVFLWNVNNLYISRWTRTSAYTATYTGAVPQFQKLLLHHWMPMSILLQVLTLAVFVPVPVSAPVPSWNELCLDLAFGWSMRGCASATGRPSFHTAPRRALYAVDKRVNTLNHYHSSGYYRFWKESRFRIVSNPPKSLSPLWLYAWLPSSSNSQYKRVKDSFVCGVTSCGYETAEWSYLGAVFQCDKC